MSTATMDPKHRVSTALVVAVLTCLTPLAAAGIDPKYPDGAHTRSWIEIESSCVARTLEEGDPWPVAVDYYLDPSEAAPGTTLTIWVGGPWIDVPDGRYAKERGHISYPGLFGQVAAKAGLQHEVFTLKVPPALPHNRLLIIVNFRDAAQNGWPWEVRRDGPWFHRKGGYFELETGKPANLFRYQDPVVVLARMKQAAVGGGPRLLSYRVHDYTGAVVAKGSIAFQAMRQDQVVPIRLNLQRRGTFLIEANVSGWESRETTFCRIPDLIAITKGARTPFGVTNVVAPADPRQLQDMCRAARLLGFTSCRTFANWYEMEPGPGRYTMDDWARALDVGRKEGIDTWLCIYGAPAWSLRGRIDSFQTDYKSVRVDWSAWKNFVHAASTRFRGSLFGWEWLNEITPGGSQSPVDDYLKLCRIGTQTAKGVDPRLTTIMAGGLWPRSYRLEMLKAGVAKWVDVLPIHYSSGDGVREAREDLAAAGRTKVAVWDDESAKGANAWGVPPREELANTAQSDWVLRQWTDELSAGVRRLIYFGGTGDPCGNWSYLLDDLSPRPVAATLAVFSSKLCDARPLGVFALGKGGRFHLFERGGRPLLVCFAAAGSEEAILQVGSRPVRRTDYQGNEEVVPAPGGIARVRLGELPAYLEGGDLDVLKSYVACQVLARRGAGSSAQLGAPHVTLLGGRRGQLYIRVRNIFGRGIVCRMRVDVPRGWSRPPETVVTLPPGVSRDAALQVAMPASVDPRDYPARVLVSFSWSKLPPVSLACVLSVITADMVGNLIPNGGFENADSTGKAAADWPTNGKTSLWEPADGLGDGLGKHVIEFANSTDWIGTSHTLDLRGGQTYLYSAWIWNQNMHAGSNIYQDMADGSRSSLFDQQVFNSGTGNDGWQLYTCHYNAPPGLKRATFSPLAQGAGWARFDNVRVTVYEGTDYAAECVRAKSPPPVYGRLEGWSTACPIPLIGRNQLTTLDASYKWSPANLSAIAYLMWDDADLYVTVRVRDDAHRPSGTGDTVVSGDSVILAFDPTNRAPGGTNRAFAYYLSAASPGGGSGKMTLYRPAQYSGGLRSGQLLKDSSIYDMSIRREESYTVYQVRLPFSELGGLRPVVGAKMGLAIQVTDNDGKGPAAHLNWGDGLSPSWRPAAFGVVTFTR